MGTIAEAFRVSGIWMYLILVISIFALGIVLERFIFLFFKYNINALAFMRQIEKLVMAGNIDRALKLCSAAQDAALPKVVKAGLMRARKSKESIQNAIEEATLEVIPLVTRRTPALLALANIATLLGLLGTIVGLIDAFAALENAAPEERQQLLARGISLAMYTTAAGLIVAIPTMLFHLFLSGMTKKIVEEIDQNAVKIENLLVAQARGTAAAE
ncbi:MAG: MotA/TolQ/ExbB proton channel family protein [Deltaproteobacteria bacterium]|nr:MAG: MotA/TolQ/ExbB proton channel family protein [Deltaproteobacteria bacterium]